MADAPLSHLAAAMAGEFDNRQQSLADPAWFLHLRLWQRPLPATVFGTGYGFFVEQIGVASGKPPYRQRVVHLSEGDRGLWAQYYALVDPTAYIGAATDPDRLSALGRADLLDLPTCGLTVTPDGLGYRARLPDDCLCSFTIGETTTYVRLAFDLGPLTPGGPVVLQMGDRGIDPTTGKATWGPQMGPFQLVRQTVYPLP